MLAPVAAAARAAADRVSEGAHVRRPDPSRGSARTLARKWLERRCSAVGKSAGRVSPREGRAEKERLSGLRGEREDRELGKPARLRPWEERGRGGAWWGVGSGIKHTRNRLRVYSEVRLGSVHTWSVARVGRRWSPTLDKARL